MQKIGSTLYKGLKRDIWLDPKQTKPLTFHSQTGFTIGPTLAQDQHALQEALASYGIEELRKIISKKIAQLQDKSITVPLSYTTQAGTTVVKETQTTIRKYLEDIGFDRNLQFEIGAYEREWGINTIDPLHKTFTLYFNRNLIRLDDGEHIEHVVAHELAHVFFRDHGQNFQETLQKLDPSSSWSQQFFSKGVSSVGKSISSTNLLIILLLILAGIGLWYGYQFLLDIVSNQTSENLF